MVKRFMVQKFPGYDQYCQNHPDTPKFVGSIGGKACWVMKEPACACAYAWRVQKNVKFKAQWNMNTPSVAWWDRSVLVERLEDINFMTQELWDREGLTKLVDKPVDKPLTLMLGGVR